jgi:hypothetical protein
VFFAHARPLGVTTYLRSTFSTLGDSGTSGTSLRLGGSVHNSDANDVSEDEEEEDDEERRMTVAAVFLSGYLFDSCKKCSHSGQGRGFIHPDQTSMW